MTKREHRRFTAEQKLEILKEADQPGVTGIRGALMKLMSILRNALPIFGGVFFVMAGATQALAGDAPQAATATPSFSPTGGTYSTAQKVSIGDKTAAATIYYTTNGTTPTSKSTKYTGPIAVSKSETIKAIAAATGFTDSAVASAVYTIEVPAATPAFSPKAGTYGTAQKVAITDGTDKATIYYTTNGTTPSAKSTKYTAPIAVAKSETIKAIAVASGFTDSAVASAVYTIEMTAASPVFAPKAGTYGTAQTVSISDATADASIFYTTDGTTPTLSSTKYSGPIAVKSSETIKAIAIASGDVNSAVVSATYDISANWAETFVFRFAYADGAMPDSRLLMDGDGNFYGTTMQAGAIGDGGTVFKLSASGTLSVLHSFATSGDDGRNPEASRLVMDSAGNLYGITPYGGTNNTGTVFKISASGVESVLYSFGPGSGTDGKSPEGDLITDGAGNVYGTTVTGGTYDRGTVFKLSTSSGKESIVYSFGTAGASDGTQPLAGVIMDSAGNLCGTTSSGGTNGNGTVFKIAPSGKESFLYSFGPVGENDGQSPQGGLIMDGAGSLYGTTQFGGLNFTGTVFKVSAAGAESVVYSFGPMGGSDAQYPMAGVIMDNTGNLYGTGSSGGTDATGAVFKITPSGKESILYSFGPLAGSDGNYPKDGVIMDGAGNLWGTTRSGGYPGTGTVFEISP